MGFISRADVNECPHCKGKVTVGRPKTEKTQNQITIRTRFTCTVCKKKFFRVEEYPLMSREYVDEKGHWVF